MRIRSHLTAVLVAVLAPASVCLAIAPPDNARQDRASVSDIIYASMDNVDDVGLVIVWNGKGARTVGTCTWGSGQQGTATVKLDSSVLNEGDNYVVFVLYNKIYTGTGLFAGGKWSYNFKLKKNGRIVWENSGYRGENDKEIKYWKIFKLTPDGKGGVEITDQIPDRVQDQLQRAMVELEESLNDELDVAVPF